MHNNLPFKRADFDRMMRNEERKTRNAIVGAIIAGCRIIIASG